MGQIKENEKKAVAILKYRVTDVSGIGLYAKFEIKSQRKKKITEGHFK